MCRQRERYFRGSGSHAARNERFIFRPSVLLERSHDASRFNSLTSKPACSKSTVPTRSSTSDVPRTWHPRRIPRLDHVPSCSQPGNQRLPSNPRLNLRVQHQAQLGKISWRPAPVRCSSAPRITSRAMHALKSCHRVDDYYVVLQGAHFWWMHEISRIYVSRSMFAFACYTQISQSQIYASLYTTPKENWPLIALIRRLYIIDANICKNL
jgi:hypothetical protein